MPRIAYQRRALNRLSQKDCERIKQLYKDMPISLNAVAQLALKTNASKI
jgi:hypothetical protein